MRAANLTPIQLIWERAEQENFLHPSPLFLELFIITELELITQPEMGKVTKDMLLFIRIPVAKSHLPLNLSAKMLVKVVLLVNVVPVFTVKMGFVV